MTTPQETDLGLSLEQSRSGLRDGHRRSLMRTLFLVTGGALMVFGTLQFLNNHLLLASAEFLVSGLLFFGRYRIRRTPNLERWIYGYLISGFSFALLILIVPDASITAYVWILMIPVLSYLLLGKRAGFRLSAPFLLAGCVVYAVSTSLGNVIAVIDLLNLVLCAVLMLAFVHIYETRREEAEMKLFTMAQSDFLTGLANRASFHSTLTRTVAECARSGSGFALVIMDLDHFKVVNDTMGHDAGDQTLTRIGTLLTERVRTTDSVARLGGEEFGLILRDLKFDDSYELVDELRERIARMEVPYGDATIRLTASFGIAHFPEHGRSAETLYRVADRCLYTGKQSGRNTVVRAGVSAVRAAGQPSDRRTQS
ncbi:GGDEF domain-containing protein [Marinobacter confluentis]|uniref:diguanylate cyclase n=1 Tax=Marinobacter confluentis TaxID=1697557 RepID=A0A4Z1C2N1_9GAMM|nr:GGDEF domain-containing protein [Marinobacter confluentis]TGN39362.1 GGDEF domain-containing protein [Marinobacter confluentis]